MKFGSVCSGIEAASVAFEPLGWKAAWFSEIEPFPCALLAHHYPEVPNLGDMTAIPGLVKRGEVEAPDVFCGGTPCQAFSVAGLRNSLEDARGNLSLVFCEIANEIDAARSVLGLDPAIIFWENVPGVLSTKDNAFGCFLAGLAGEDDPLVPPGEKWTNAGCVFGPKRAVAWRVLDAQYFGLAQRRRRVFVVASARAGINPAEILFEFDGLRRDTAPSRQAGQNPTGTLSARTEGGGGLGTDFECSGGVVPVSPALVAGTIEASMGRSRGAGISPSTLCMATRQGGAEVGVDMAPTLACDQKPYVVAAQPIGNPTKTLCVATGQAGAEISSDLSPTLSCNHEAPYAVYEVTGALTGRGGRNGGQSNDDADGHKLIPVGVTIHGTDGTATVASYSDTAQCLRARPPGFLDNSSTTVVQHPMVAFGSSGYSTLKEVAVADPLRAKGGDTGDGSETLVAAPASAPASCSYGIRTANTSSNGWGIQEELSHTLDCAQAHVPCIAFSSKDHGADATDDLAPTLRAMNFIHGNQNGGGQMAVAFMPAPVIAHCTPIDMRQASRGATMTNNRAEGSTGGAPGTGIGKDGDPSPTISTSHVPAIAFAQNQRDEVRTLEVAKALAALPGMKQQTYVAQATAFTTEQTPKFNEDCALTLTKQSPTGGGQIQSVLTPMQVRRLTPEECEALQGFPEVKKNVKIRVCFDHQNPSVPAETQCPKSPNNARSAGRAESLQSASVAAPNSRKSHQTGIGPVAVNVRIDLGRMHLQLHSAGKLLLSASLAESQSRYPLFTQLGNIAQELAKVLANLERTATAGRVASHPHINPSLAQLNGSPFVELSGQEIDAFANDAETFTAKASAFMKSITSQAGQSSLSCSETLKTLCCFAAAAISSCIQEKTNWASSYEISVEVAQGYTAVPNRGKPAADGLRYKALGNSWAVPNVRWIGRRVNAAIQAITDKPEAA